MGYRSRPGSPHQCYRPRPAWRPGFAVHRRKRRSARILPIDTNIHVASAFQTLRQRRGDAGNVLHHLLNLPGHTLNVGNIIAVHYNADRALIPVASMSRRLRTGGTHTLAMPAATRFYRAPPPAFAASFGRHCSRELKVDGCFSMVNGAGIGCRLLPDRLCQTRSPPPGRF